MNIKNICKKVIDEIGIVTISKILDVGDSFVIMFCGEYGEDLDMSSLKYNKQTGEIDVAFYPDMKEQIDAGIPIDVPEEFKPKARD